MKSWDLQKTQYSVADFLGWQRDKALMLSPNFQRRPVWPKGAKSYLIDTILRGLPVPVILLRDRATNIKSLKKEREVVDGQQRLRTVLSYIAPDSLEDFNAERDGFTMSKAHNKSLAGKGFSDLEADLRQKILDYQFSVQVFPATAEDSDILQIFARLNATGLKLNKQELRNSEYFGEFKTASYVLAAEHLNFWRKSKLFSEDQIARMLEVEFTSEILILILKGITGGNAATISKIYKDYNLEFSRRDEVENRFRVLMKSVSDFLEESDAYSMFGKRIIAYAVSACIYNQIYGLNSSIEKGKPKNVSVDYQKKILKKLKIFSEGNAPDDISEIASRRTTHLGSRKAIFDFFNAS